MKESTTQLTTGLSAEARRRIDQLSHNVWELERSVPGILELPEPALVLDLARRKGDERAQFKHLQQCCVLHSTHLKHSNVLSFLNLVRAYLVMCEVLNPLGVYWGARALLEFHTYINRAYRDLHAPAASQTHWRLRGEQYFAAVVRARYGTSDPAMVDLLAKAGVSKECLKPYNVTQCMSTLAAESGFADAAARYARLCDHVHPNLSSRRTANAGARVGTVARSTGGGLMILPRDTAIVTYRRPCPERAFQAIDETVESVTADSEHSLQRINGLPDGPFSPAEILQHAGTQSGFEELGVAGTVRIGE